MWYINEYSDNAKINQDKDALFPSMVQSYQQKFFGVLVTGCGRCPERRPDCPSCWERCWLTVKSLPSTAFHKGRCITKRSHTCSLKAACINDWSVAWDKGLAPLAPCRTTLKSHLSSKALKNGALLQMHHSSTSPLPNPLPSLPSECPAHRSPLQATPGGSWPMTVCTRIKNHQVGTGCLFPEVSYC